MPPMSSTVVIIVRGGLLLAYAALLVACLVLDDLRRWWYGGAAWLVFALYIVVAIWHDQRDRQATQELLTRAEAALAQAEAVLDEAVRKHKE